MDNLKKLLNAVLFPKKAYGIVMGIIFIAASIAVILLELDGSPVAYVSYLLGAYGLYLVIMASAVPLVKRVKIWMRKNPYIDRYFTDAGFNARVALYRSAILNIGYAIFKLAVGLRLGSMWFVAIAVYYMILSGIRFVLIRTDLRVLKRDGDESLLLHEWKAYRTSACLIMLLNLSLLGIVIQVIRDGRSYSYPGTIIFAMAFYAFYRIVVAAIRLFRDRKNRGPVFSAAKTIDFTFAVIALFTLQTAMLSTFDESGSAFAFTTNIVGGSATFAIVLGIASYMIIRSSKQIKLLEAGDETNV